MITIKNTQRTVTINKAKLERDAQHLLQLLGYDDFDLGIWLTSTKTIRHYNNAYRNNDKATDVLSFAYHAALKAGQRIVAKSPDDKNLGDLIMAPAYIKEDAKKLGVTFELRLQRLLVHGICHLLGYDHEHDNDYKIMHKKEMALLKKMLN